MKVFISWSGEASNALAVALADWVPKVLQGVEPFVSSKDIDKGATWVTTLADELKDSDFGIICLTPENLSSPWLHYEAGAIYKSVSSRVCPVLLGVDKAQVQSPFNQLQCTDLKLDEVSRLMLSMNKAAGSPVDVSQLEETVQVWWPKLEEKLQAISIPSASKPRVEGHEPKKPEPELDEMLEEVLRRLRNIEHSVDRVRRVEGAERESSGRDRFRISHELEAAGLKVIRIARGPGVYVVDVEVVGWPLAPELEATLHSLARRFDTKIRLRGSDAQLVIHQSGEVSLLSISTEETA